MKDRRYSREFDLPDKEEAATLLRRYRGSPLESRARLLLEIVNNPGASIKRLMEVSDRSRRTVNRYLKVFREKGYKVLMEESERRRKLEQWQQDIVVARLRNRSFETMQLARDWVEREFDVSYSVQGLTELLDKELHFTRRLMESPKQGEKESSVDPIKLMNLMNRVPRNLAVDEYVLEMRNALTEFLPDVENVVVYVATGSRMGQGVKGTASASFLKIDDIKNDAKAERKTEDFILQGENEQLTVGQIEELIIERMKENEKFNPDREVNVSRHYNIAENDPVGFVIATLPKSSNKKEWVNELLHQLAPYLTTCLMNAVLRTRYVMSSSNEDLTSKLQVLASASGLTPRQVEVLILYSHGNTTPEMASILDIAASTVEKHIASIHKKTGLHTPADVILKAQKMVVE